MVLRGTIVAIFCACVIGQVLTYRHAQRIFNNVRISPSPFQMLPSPPGSRLKIVMRPISDNIMMLKQIDTRTGQWLKMLVPRIRIRHQARPMSKRKPFILKGLRMSNIQRARLQALRPYLRKIPQRQSHRLSTRINEQQKNPVIDGLEFLRYKSRPDSRRHHLINTNRQQIPFRREKMSTTTIPRLPQQAVRLQHVNLRQFSNSFMSRRPTPTMAISALNNRNWAGTFERPHIEDINDLGNSFDFGQDFDDAFDDRFGMNIFDDGQDDDDNQFQLNTHGTGDMVSPLKSDSSQMGIAGNNAFDTDDESFSSNLEDSDWFLRNVNAIPFDDQELLDDRNEFPQSKFDPESTDIHDSADDKKDINVLRRNIDEVSGFNINGDSIDDAGEIRQFHKESDEQNIIVAVGGKTNAINADGIALKQTLNQNPAQLSKVSELSSSGSVKIDVFDDFQNSNDLGSVPIQGLELLGQRRATKHKDLGSKGPTPSLLPENVMTFPHHDPSTMGPDIRSNGLGQGAFALLGIDANTIQTNSGNTGHANIGSNVGHSQPSHATVGHLPDVHASSSSLGFPEMLPTLDQTSMPNQGQMAPAGQGFDMGMPFSQNSVFEQQNMFDKSMIGALSSLDKLDLGIDGFN